MRTMGQLNDLAIFIEVVRSGGFRAAARRLGLGPGSVSQAVQRFEDRLGTRLLERTTRSIALTEAGRIFYERCLPSVNEIEGAMQELDDLSETLSGTLKLSAPRSAGPLFLDDLMAKYLTVYPEAQVDLTYEDCKVDIVTAGLDLAIRAHTLLEQDTYAIPVGPALTMTVVVAPAYLARHGTPKTPACLAQHDCLCFRLPNTNALAPWSFRSANGSYTVTPRPKVIVNDLSTLLRLAEKGAGFAYVYGVSARKSLTAGTLVSVFDGQTLPLPRYAINYVSKRHMPARLKAFIGLAKNV